MGFLARWALFLALSVAIHLAIGMVWSGVFTSSIAVVGSEDGDEERIFCTVVYQEDMIAQAVAAAVSDAVPSSPSECASPDKKREPAESQPLLEHSNISEKESNLGVGTPVIAAQSPEVPESMFVDTKDSSEAPENEHDSDTDRERSTQMRHSSSASVASTPQIASNLSQFRAAKGRGLADFRARIVSAIQEASFFPKEAAQRRQHGEITVDFAITRDGSLENLQVTTPSGSKALDDAALEIVRKASSSFPPFPSSIIQDRLRYVVPIIFKKEARKKK